MCCYYEDRSQASQTLGLKSASADRMKYGMTSVGLTSAQTTSRFPAAGGAIIPIPYHLQFPSKSGQGLGGGCMRYGDTCRKCDVRWVSRGRILAWQMYAQGILYKR